VRKELKRLGWTKAELKRRRKGDASKVALESSMTSIYIYPESKVVMRILFGSVD
jgi:hypothetical protein